MSSFLQTQPHLTVTGIGQSTIRTGPVVPEGAINLAYYVNKKLHPNDNVAISDAMRLVVENVAQDLRRELMMTPDQSGVLKDKNGNSILATEFVEITNKFVGDVPLYYACRLKNLFYDKEASEGEYKGKSISVEKENGQPLYGDTYKYKIYLEKVGSIPGVFSITVYTSFVVDNVNKVVGKFNSVKVDGSGITETNPGWKEKINPVPFFKAGQHFSYLPEQAVVKNNRIDLSSFMSVSDTRNSKKFKFRIKTISGITTGWTDAYAVDKEAALPHEVKSFFGDSMMISPKVNGKHLTAEDMLILTGKTKEELVDEIYLIEIQATAAIKAEINLTVDPSGQSAPLCNVSTKCNTMVVPEKYEIIGSKYVESFSVKMKDHRVISLQSPLESEVYENWYPRISSGHFEKEMKDKDGDSVLAIYRINEYHGQQYSFKYGKPYIEIEDEKAEVLDEITIKTRFKNLYVILDANGLPLNLRPVRINNKTEVPLHVSGWNASKGIIEVAEKLSSSDNIRVDYTYEEDCYTYRGCKVENMFIRVDLNPNKYHTYDKIDYTVTGRVLNVEKDNVYNLFNLPMSVFLRPAKVIKNGVITEENEFVLYHKFDETPLGAMDLFLGKIYLKHNTTFGNMKIIDTRVRGGGILETITDDIRRELEPESDFYYDIGFWDGEPYSENSVIIVRLDSQILVENGGRFSKEEVQKVVNKWVAYGTLVIVEYMKTFSEDNMAAKTLRIEKVHVNRLNFKPAMSAEVFDKIKTPYIVANVIDTTYVPCGIIKAVEIEKPKEFITKLIKSTNIPDGFVGVKVTRGIEEPVVISKITNNEGE